MYCSVLIRTNWSHLDFTFGAMKIYPWNYRNWWGHFLVSHERSILWVKQKLVIIMIWNSQDFRTKSEKGRKDMDLTKNKSFARATKRIPYSPRKPTRDKYLTRAWMMTGSNCRVGALFFCTIRSALLTTYRMKCTTRANVTSPMFQSTRWWRETPSTRYICSSTTSPTSPAWTGPIPAPTRTCPTRWSTWWETDCFWHPGDCVDLSNMELGEKHIGDLHTGKKHTEFCPFGYLHMRIL